MAPRSPPAHCTQAKTDGAKVSGDLVPPHKILCLSFPRADTDGRWAIHMHLHAHMCANTPEAMRLLHVQHAMHVSWHCMHMHTCRHARPHQPQQQQWDGCIVPVCRSMFHHAHTQVFPCACQPLFPGQLLPQGHSRVVPRQPPELVPLYRVGVYTDTHTHVCAQTWRHPPSSRGKSSPRTGAPTPQLLGDSET